MEEIRPIEWENGTLMLLDQTRLPHEEATLEIRQYKQAIAAIKEMRVRGAPAIGVAAAYAVVLAAREVGQAHKEDFIAALTKAAQEIASARPTAVNLQWAVERMLKRARESRDGATAVQEALEAEAVQIHHEDVEANRRMGAHGAPLIPEGGAILTHCNAGALATAGYGTALGVIRAAWEQGKRFRVFNTETRPLLQGARLTAWELKKLGIPSTLVVDSAAASLLRLGRVSCVIVGADRIAANGDVANKIGTYALAVLAHENGVPFYVAAPTSTIDLRLSSGEAIPIEERAPQEITHFRDTAIAPGGVAVYNPAFDVTPYTYVSALITEAGVIRHPLKDGIREVTAAINRVGSRKHA